MNYKLEKNGKSCLLELEGDLVMDDCGELRAALLKALEKDDSVAIRLDKVTGVDLTCLQLLCSACRTSLSRNKRAEITGAIPEIFLKAVREAGFARQKGCALDRGPGCLWTRFHEEYMDSLDKNQKN